MSKDNPWKDAEQDEVSSENPLLNGVDLMSLEKLAWTNPEWTERVDQKTQEQWLEYGSRVLKDSGKYVASMADMYKIFKIFVMGTDEEKGRYCTNPANGLASMQLMIWGSRTTTSTRIAYEGDDYSIATIIHNYGTDKESTKSVRAPKGGEIKLKEIIEGDGSGDHLRFFQALLGTEDNAETIVNVLNGFLGNAIYGVIARGERLENSVREIGINHLGRGPRATGWIDNARPNEKVAYAFGVNYTD